MDVTENEDGLVTTIKTDKRIHAFQIYKPNDGFAMFKIKYQDNNTPVPSELSGYYTSSKYALDTLKRWVDTAEPTKQKEWEDKYKDVVPPTLKVKPNGAKVRSESN